MTFLVMQQVTATFRIMTKGCKDRSLVTGKYACPFVLPHMLLLSANFFSLLKALHGGAPLSQVL